MTVGGISSSLNSTLARLSTIENNFQALNGVAFEIDLKQNFGTQNVQNSDFKTILDEKVKNAENNSQQPQITELEPIDFNEENSIIIEPQTEVSNSEESNQAENTIPAISQEKTADNITNEENKADIDIEEIKKDPIINLKSKITIQKPSENTAKTITSTNNTNNINEIIETLSDKYGIDSDFVKAIIKQESGFNPKATSKKGAMGLMQLMPATAKSLGIQDAYNPSQNIEGGVKHLKNLLNKYSNNQELALAAYNAGSGAVKKYGGVPPYKETQNYVKSIMATYTKAKEAKI